MSAEAPPLDVPVSVPPGRLPAWRQQPAETRIILENVSWRLYEQLLAEHPDRPSPRFVYSDGFLEIMTVGFAHENPNRTLASLVELVATEWELDSLSAGQVTCKRRDLKKGFEPDSCFYFGPNAERLRGRKKLVLPRDPAPELIIEIDITHSSLPRQPIFAAFGVAEVWRYEGDTLRILRLEKDRYVEVAESSALAPLTGEIATRFLRESQTVPHPAWARRVRTWAQTQLASGARTA